MVENNNALAQVPAQSLVDLARRATAGEVSPRRHAASRSRILDHAATAGRSRPGWVLPTVLITAGFGVVGAGTAVAVARQPMHPAPMVVTPIPTSSPLMTVSSITMGNPSYLGADDKTASMTIEVSPPSAQIFWDNERLDGNPARLAQAPDGKTHHVRAEAPGFLPKRQMVVFDARNVAISLDLQPAPAEIGPIAVSGSIRNADAAIEGLRERFRDCYAEGLEHTRGGERKTPIPTPVTGGAAVLLLKISETGTVSASEVVENNGLPAKTTTCFAYVAADAEFEASGKAGSVRIPISFGAAK
jgi:hypothetical protein